MVSSITQDPYSIPKSLCLASFTNIKIGTPPRVTELGLHVAGARLPYFSDIGASIAATYRVSGA